MDITYKDYFKEDVLNEIFNTIYPYKKAYGDNDSSEYRFSSKDGSGYNVYIRNDDKASKYSQINNDILRKNGIIVDKTIEVSFSKITEDGDEFETFDIDKSIDALGVLSTVLKIINDNISKDDVIVFTAKESSRIKLYDRMISRFRRSGDELITGISSIAGKVYCLVPKSKLQKK